MPSKLAAGAFVLLALVFTFVILFAIFAIVGFAGFDALFRRPLEFLIVLLLAGSPVPVWSWCVRRARRTWAKR
ncbi:hypothetical protein [Novosphingobium sp. BW1]|uniref:hypothetical protein n=1 Tax=Novosphingobium sp. BW1 TaxID=2592621 RepID=UPI0011DE771B|nr:hypothetical protein [Novosphingobium sp. BW1]TYC86985.1 hypothetical protein FMM79_14135 [Novosphingobium sp. BW1]